MVLAEIGVDPGVYLFLRWEEDHVLIDHEKAIGLWECEAGGDDSFGIVGCFIGVIGLF